MYGYAVLKWSMLRTGWSLQLHRLVRHRLVVLWLASYRITCEFQHCQFVTVVNGVGLSRCVHISVIYVSLSNPLLFTLTLSALLQM